MDASRAVMPGLKCSLCGAAIPEGSGVVAYHKNNCVKLCSSCLRAVNRAYDGTEYTETTEVRGVFYAVGDFPLPPPIHAMRNPKVTYHESPKEETKQQEPPTYKPKIPPRRPPG